MTGISERKCLEYSQSLRNSLVLKKYSSIDIISVKTKVRCKEHSNYQYKKTFNYLNDNNDIKNFVN